MGNKLLWNLATYDVSHDSLHYVQLVSYVWLVFLFVPAEQEIFFS